MKKLFLYNLLLLAVLFSGCKKDNSGRVRIFAEEMKSGAKIWVNPSSVSTSASWIEGEVLNINGVGYTITRTGDKYYINNVPLDIMHYAVYPATTTAGGNDIEVTNNGGSGATITLNRLAINFRDGGHDIVFPMAARSADDADTLRFRHLTGGFRLTLSNNTATTVHTLKVVVQGISAAPPVTIGGIDYTTAWAVQGPTMPNDTVGQTSGDVEVKFSSEMVFAMQTGGVSGVTIPAAGSRTFCVPVTVSTVRRLTISGYDSDGSQLFVATKELGNIAVVRNTMYNIPNIQIN